MNENKFPYRIWCNPNNLSLHDFSQCCPVGFRGLGEGVPTNFAPYLSLEEHEQKLSEIRAKLEDIKRHFGNDQILQLGKAIEEALEIAR